MFSSSNYLFIESFRNEFDIVDAKVNSLHGPRTRAEANRNLHFFFPEERILAVLKPNLTDQQKCNELICLKSKEKLFLVFYYLAEIAETFKKAGFFILARKTEKLTPEQAAQLQHSHHGKDYYDELINYMTRLVYSIFFRNEIHLKYFLVVHLNYWYYQKKMPVKLGKR
jgi:nucleoside diphosphate kinase